MEAVARSWSAQQENIYDWFERGGGHLVVQARAGCGKTTTIIEGVNRAPEKRILLCAYNKRIAEELQGRVTNPNVTVKTLHALGYAAVRKFWEGVGCSFNSDRENALAEKVCGPSAPDAIKKLVAKLSTKGREIVPHATTPGPLADLAVTFELEPDEQWHGCLQCGDRREEHEGDHAYRGFDLLYVEEKALAAMELAATVKPPSIDGSDMIFLPVRNGWLQKAYDLVVVDEAQDMSNAQLEIAQGVCRGRICIVGDDRQAIYGFRGADSESLNRLKKELNASLLKLTTTYRCGTRIVALAAELVSDFQAGETNPPGEILSIRPEGLTPMASAGDFVLSRLNAPLVSTAMGFLRAGKRTMVAGRDIGAGLKTLIRKMKGRSVPDLLAKLAAWEAKEVKRLKKFKREDRIEAVRDQVEMLGSLADDARNVDEVVGRIDALFTDDGLGAAGVITCSSVHRAKGLEANRVFILKDTLRDGSIEELNIQYVAITRAKSTLVWVEKERDEERERRRW